MQINHKQQPRVATQVMYELTEIPPEAEAERAASGIRRLKAPYRTTMLDVRESNLNLIQLQHIVKIDIAKVAELFIHKNKRRTFKQTTIILYCRDV